MLKWRAQVLPGLFPPTPAATARDRALAQVADHACEGFIDLAVLAVERVARKRAAFIVDDVWAEFDDAATTHDKRAMGPVMAIARQLGYIAPTADFVASKQVQCHANPRRVWKSLIYVAPESAAASG